MAESNRLMTDEELCELLRISRATMHRHLKDGPPSGGIDLRSIKRVTVGGGRRWLRESVNSAIEGATKG